MEKPAEMLTAQDVRRLTGVTRDMFYLWQRMGLLPDYTRFERQGKIGGGVGLPTRDFRYYCQDSGAEKPGKDLPGNCYGLGTRRSREVIKAVLLCLLVVVMGLAITGLIKAWREDLKEQKRNEE